MLDLDTSLREIRRLDAELAAERAETAKLRAEVAAMRPVFLRAIEWREDPEMFRRQKALIEAVDAADGEQSE